LEQRSQLTPTYDLQSGGGVRRSGKRETVRLQVQILPVASSLCWLESHPDDLQETADEGKQSRGSGQPIARSRPHCHHDPNGKGAVLKTVVRNDVHVQLMLMAYRL
jgi:hypothetical protein